MFDQVKKDGQNTRYVMPDESVIDDLNWIFWWKSRFIRESYMWWWICQQYDLISAKLNNLASD